MPGENTPAATQPEAAATDAQLPDRLQFPPFPQPPPGTTIIPFEDFVPRGIQINLDAEPDAEEVDGLGIKTVELSVKHDFTEAERKKRRKTTGKRATAIGPDGQVRKLTWWEEWEEGEQYRRMSPIPSASLPYLRSRIESPLFLLDSPTNRVERLFQACDEFKSTRPWPHTSGTITLLNLWDVVSE